MRRQKKKIAENADDMEGQISQDSILEQDEEDIPNEVELSDAITDQDQANDSEVSKNNDQFTKL